MEYANDSMWEWLGIILQDNVQRIYQKWWSTIYSATMIFNKFV